METQNPQIADDITASTWSCTIGKASPKEALKDAKNETVRNEPAAQMLQASLRLFHLKFSVPFLHHEECFFLLSFIRNQSLAVEVILEPGKLPAG